MNNYGGGGIVAVVAFALARELPPLEPTAGHAFLAVNPAAKLPVLVDGDFVLTESVAIVVPIARQDFLDMAAVLEKHMDGRQFLVGDNVTVADFVAAYTLDMASVQERQMLLRQPASPARVHGADV
jgi:glutathione S-transferase